MSTLNQKNNKDLDSEKKPNAFSHGAEATIYNAQGKKTGTVTLPENIFGVKWNDSLMHQVVTSMQDNARTPVAHTKNRGEVRGGGKKPWRQKGTGRARHGSTRSPIWVGGGVAHGPRNEKVFARGIPQNMRRKALAIALSKKMADGHILFVDSLGLSEPKTAVAKKTLTALAAVKGFERLADKKKNAALIALPEKSAAAEKSFRNLGHVACVRVSNLNPLSVLRNTYLVIENPASSLKIIESRFKELSSKLATSN